MPCLRMEGSFLHIHNLSPNRRSCPILPPPFCCNENDSKILICCCYSLLLYPYPGMKAKRYRFKEKYVVAVALSKVEKLYQTLVILFVLPWHSDSALRKICSLILLELHTHIALRLIIRGPFQFSNCFPMLQVARFMQWVCMSLIHTKHVSDVDV